MSGALACYKCGASLAALSLPFRRLEECPQCSRELHVCRMCQSYDSRSPKGCLEEDAPEVRDKERANFCDYFKASAAAFVPGELDAEQRAQGELAALFGDELGADQGRESSPPSDSEASRTAAENLFKK